jgi:hypothetical protein
MTVILSCSCLICTIKMFDLLCILFDCYPRAVLGPAPSDATAEAVFGGGSGLRKSPSASALSPRPGTAAAPSPAASNDGDHEDGDEDVDTEDQTAKSTATGATILTARQRRRAALAAARGETAPVSVGSSMLSPDGAVFDTPSASGVPHDAAFPSLLLRGKPGGGAAAPSSSPLTEQTLALLQQGVCVDACT